MDNLNVLPYIDDDYKSSLDIQSEVSRLMSKELHNSSKKMQSYIEDVEMSYLSTDVDYGSVWMKNELLQLQNNEKPDRLDFHKKYLIPEHPPVDLGELQKAIDRIKINIQLYSDKAQNLELTKIFGSAAWLACLERGDLINNLMENELNSVKKNSTKVNRIRKADQESLINVFNTNERLYGELATTSHVVGVENYILNRQVQIRSKKQRIE